MESPNPSSLARWRFAIIALIMIAGVSVRAWKISSPPLDFHPMRQFDYAVLARADFYEAAAGIPEGSRSVALTNRAAIMQLEPRVLPRLAALGYRLAGSEQLWIGRGFSIVFWAIGGLVLYHLARQLFSEGAAMCTLAVHQLWPFALLASRSFQPDPLMVTLMTASLAFLWKDHQNPSGKRFFWACLLAAAAVIVKPTCIVIPAVVLACLEYARLGLRRTFVSGRVWLYALCVGVPMSAYYAWATYNTPDMQQQTGATFQPALLLESRYWMGWAHMIGRVCGWLPGALALIGAFLQEGRSKRVFLISGWLGYLAYGLVFNYHTHTHDYYTLPLIPIFALSFGALLNKAMSKLEAPSARRYALAGFAALTLLAAVGLIHARRTDPKRISSTSKELALKAGALLGVNKKFLLFLVQDPSDFREQVTMMEEIGEVVGHSTRTVMIDPDAGQALRYYAEIGGRTASIKGKRRELQSIDPAALAQLKVEDWLTDSRGADFLIVTDLYEFNVRQPELKDLVTSRFPVFKQTESYLIFDLRAHAGSRGS